MTLPPEVVLDLLPLYLADEVNPTTRKLVEDYLSQDPLLAERVRQMRVAPPPLPAPPPDLGLLALRRTRKLLARQRWVMGFALMFTGFAASFQFSAGGGRGVHVHWLMATHPAAAAACAAVAAALWVTFGWQRRRLAV
ncbi:MAG TPA: hypothetical protein VIE13_05510 [Terriglobales bacterium]|jgi:transposase InsO family protein